MYLGIHIRHNNNYRKHNHEFEQDQEGWKEGRERGNDIILF